MESSGTPASGSGTAPPPPPPPARADDDRPGWGSRLLALVLAIALIVGLFLVVALGVVALDSVDCDDQAAVAQAILEDGADATCYDNSILRVAIIGFSFASAAVGLIALMFTLGYVFTARYRERLMRFTALAVTLGAIAWIVALLD